MALQKVLFDPRKLTDIGKTSAMDFAELNALRAAGGFGHSGRSLMTSAVNDYVEVANALFALSTLDTLGNCDSLNKKDETRRQFGPVQDRQGIIHVGIAGQSK